MKLLTHSCYFEPRNILVGVTWQNYGGMMQVYLYLLCWIVDISWSKNGGR
jgi:hypothetical protein